MDTDREGRSQLHEKEQIILVVDENKQLIDFEGHILGILPLDSAELLNKRHSRAYSAAKASGTSGCGSAKMSRERDKSSIKPGQLIKCSITGIDLSKPLPTLIGLSLDSLASPARVNPSHPDHPTSPDDTSHAVSIVS